MTWDGTLRAEVAAVRLHTEAYVSEILGIPLRECPVVFDKPNEIGLRSLSTLIAMGGATSVLVCFTVDQALADELLRIESAGLDLDGMDRGELVQATLSELANIVLGHCTTNLCSKDQSVSLSAPVVISVERLRPPPEKSSFARLTYETRFGMMDVFMFGPRESIDFNSMCDVAS